MMMMMIHKVKRLLIIKSINNISTPFFWDFFNCYPFSTKSIVFQTILAVVLLLFLFLHKFLTKRFPDCWWRDASVWTGAKGLKVRLRARQRSIDPGVASGCLDCCSQEASVGTVGKGLKVGEEALKVREPAWDWSGMISGSLDCWPKDASVGSWGKGLKGSTPEIHWSVDTWLQNPLQTISISRIRFKKDWFWALGQVGNQKISKRATATQHCHSHGCLSKASKSIKGFPGAA